MIYPQDFEIKIGFDTIRRNLSEKCTSRLGRDEVLKMKFSADRNAVIHSLDCVREMVSIRSQALPFPAPSSHDVIPYLVEIKAQHSFMSSDRLYKLMSVLQSFAEVAAFFSTQKVESSDTPLFPALTDEMRALGVFPALVREIGSCIDKFGEVKDSASPELYEIREAIRRAQGSMQRAMRRVMDRAISAGIIESDVNPAMRDGRLVIPVAAGQKRQLSGIVHDESATGKTVYIEPAEVVEAANKLKELEMDEKREITVILMRLADSIRPYIDEISQSCHLLGRLDFIGAKASLAIELDAQMPHFDKNPTIEWYHAFHPGLYLALKSQGREVVPLDITLSKEKRILIISGPNAGGKSVCLKTVAIVQYMMQCGLLPTLYDNSHMGFFSNLFIDIGDEQSFENDLSTYSSHLANMKYFLLHSNRFTLFLADEMGTGTEPQIGGAMAQSILDHLGKTGCFGVVSTHYQNLKTFADNTPGFVNGAMLYDRQHLQPTFQLSIGNPGSSFALDIAYKMGLPRDVIDEAKQIVGDEYVNLDKYLSDIARDRKYWANKRQNIREKESKLENILSKYEEAAGDLKSQRNAIISAARSEAKEILSEANARIERTILEIRKAQAEKERTKELRKNLKDYIDETENPNKDDDKLPKQLQQLPGQGRRKKKAETTAKPEPAPAKKEISAGDYVKLKDGNSVGEVISVSGKKAVVAFGALRTIVETAKLQHASKPKKSGLDSNFSVSASTSADSRSRQLNFKNEIDVRGMRADEALQAVTYFIDDAIQFNAGKVRILHGTGHGILKTLIRQLLKTNPAIRSFEDEDIRFGGAGITVVELE